MMHPELLAPAGSRESLIAAIANGADAVYLGGTLFNARQTASNFDHEALKEAVRLAHRSGVRVYVTVNTLIKDRELPEALSFLQFLFNIGADAAIVQDPGLIAAAREYVPGLELHASTQMTIHNQHGVNALADLGIKRVVLARELSVDQIADIASGAKVGLEIFVHGALCISYSGQCLFSSMVGGRSGNRGLCAQPCRLPYQLQPGSASGHLLSPKDVCLLPHLARLLKLNVDAWKIEGRLKRPSYVAATVRHYREVRDALLAGEPVSKIDRRIREMSQAFTRGYSSGYVIGRPGKALLTDQGPGHQGVVIGTVLGDGQVKLDEGVDVGDVLLSPDGREHTVSQTQSAGQALLGPSRLRPGQQVFRLRSQAQEQAAAEQVQHYSPPEAPLELHAALQVGKPLVLYASSGGKSITVTGSRVSEAARSVAVSDEMLERQLTKLGGSGFQLVKFSAEVEPGLSLPVSEINHCRRAAVELLGELLWGQPNPLTDLPALPAPRISGVAKPASWSIAVSTLDALQEAIQHPFQRVYYGASWYTEPIPDILQQYTKARQACEDLGIECYLRLPRIMLPKEADAWKQALVTQEVQGLLVPNFGAVEIARELKLPFTLDSSMHIMNAWALKAFEEAEAGVLSPELNQGEIRSLLQEAASKSVVTVHVRNLLMVHEQCLVGANTACGRAGRGCPGVVRHLQDRKGYIFPMLSDATCRSYIYNSQVFSLIDQLGPLMYQGAHELLIDAEMDDAATLSSILPLYILAKDRPGRSGQERDMLSAFYSGSLTRGHWKRGV